MKCILFGSTGEVGSAVARELIKSDVCTQLTMLARRTIPNMQEEDKVKKIVFDTSSPNFENVVKEKAYGHDVAISCVGIGSGTVLMKESDMMDIEVVMLGRYARGCKAAGIERFELLTAVGVNENSVNSNFKALRVMGNKHKMLVEIGFEKLAIFKPGIIVGNKHTPKWLTFFTSLIPDSIGWGNIQQDELARAFVAHLEKKVTTQLEP